MADKYLQVGYIANLTGTSTRTVSKWIDNGTLVGGRMPGSRHRRVKAADLVKFLKDNLYDVPEDLQYADKENAINGVAVYLVNNFVGGLGTLATLKFSKEDEQEFCALLGLEKSAMADIRKQTQKNWSKGLEDY